MKIFSFFDIKSNNISLDSQRHPQSRKHLFVENQTRRIFSDHTYAEKWHTHVGNKLEDRWKCASIKFAKGFRRKASIIFNSLSKRSCAVCRLIHRTQANLWFSSQFSCDRRIYTLIFNSFTCFQSVCAKLTPNAYKLTFCLWISWTNLLNLIKWSNLWIGNLLKTETLKSMPLTNFQN